MGGGMDDGRGRGGGGFEKYIIYLLEIVVAAGKQESLGCVAAPAQEGRHTGSNRVVATAWGAESIHFFATLAILHQDERKNRMNCTRKI